MKVILLMDVRGVGRKHEEKEVSNGYATNYLIPRKLAKYASTSAHKELEHQKEERVKSTQANLEKLSEKLRGLDTVEIKAPANEQGHLFAAIGKKDVAEKTGLPEEIIMLDEPIKEIGSYQVLIKVGGPQHGEAGKEKKIKLEVLSLD